MKSLFLFAAVCAAAAVTHVASADSGAWTPADTRQVAHWIEDLQFTRGGLPSYGALRVHPSPAATDGAGREYVRVSPYVGNLAALGLLRSRRPEAVAVAGRWIGWFFGHLDPAGAPDGVPFEQFYRPDGTGETSCVKPGDARLCRYNDATDSAAATFFSVLEAYRGAGGDMEAIAAPRWSAEVERLSGTLLALRAPDGLFWAKQSFRAKYLEDNCEVYAGLKDLARLERTVYKRSDRAIEIEAAAERLRDAIQSELFDSERGSYFVAKFEDGTRKAADLSVWYPDLQAQFWPLLFGVEAVNAPPSRAALTALNKGWSGAPRPDWAAHPERVNGGWLSPDVAFAALEAGERERIPRYLAAVKRLKLSGTRPFDWPFSGADAGWLVSLATLWESAKSKK
jgi:hypothetical protein